MEKRKNSLGEEYYEYDIYTRTTNNEQYDSIG
jgi:hypothetical protein